MTALGRRWRLVATLVVFGLAVLGSWRGDDDHFPFGPFRMYASTQPGDAPTTWLELEVVTATGERAVLPDGAAGMRRAELEGQVGRFIDEPAALEPVLDAYGRDGRDAHGIDLVRRSQTMAEGRPRGDVTSEVVVSWRVP